MTFTLLHNHATGHQSSGNGRDLVLTCQDDEYAVESNREPHLEHQRQGPGDD